MKKKFVNYEKFRINRNVREEISLVRDDIILSKQIAQCVL